MKKEVVGLCRNVVFEMKYGKYAGVVKVLPVLLFALAFMLSPGTAHASTSGSTGSGGTAFSPILSMITGWIDGVPGIIAAIAIVLTGIFTALSKGAMSLFVSLAIAGAIFVVPSIATSIASAMKSSGAIF